MESFVGNEDKIFRYMLDNGYPVYHLSNLFYRDVQYAIRDYFRDNHRKDIGWRASDRMARELVEDLERRGVLRPHAKNTWVLFDEQYRLPSQQDTQAGRGAEAAEAVA
ncbi:MAG: hypothetical protein JXA28_00100 [Bacteroidetes bacterium]|nr:hypothetical protein [Bacteroidota bacterium]